MSIIRDGLRRRIHCGESVGERRKKFAAKEIRGERNSRRKKSVAIEWLHRILREEERSALLRDTAGEFGERYGTGSGSDLVDFGERYGTGSGSDLVDSEVISYKAPGRYRSLYRTNSPAVS